jgi:hypothetical protein
LVAQLVWDQWVGGSNPLSPTIFEEPAFLKQVFFRPEFMRMRTSEGGLSRAKRDHVALATARRASIADARNPLSPTIFEEPAFLKQVFFRPYKTFSPLTACVVYPRHTRFLLSQTGDIYPLENNGLTSQPAQLSFAGDGSPAKGERKRGS